MNDTTSRQKQRTHTRQATHVRRPFKVPKEALRVGRRVRHGEMFAWGGADASHADQAGLSVCLVRFGLACVRMVLIRFQRGGGQICSVSPFLPAHRNHKGHAADVARRGLELLGFLASLPSFRYKSPH